MSMDIPLPIINNIVATSQIQTSLTSLDLDRINKLLPFSFYDKEKFAAITIRLSKPDCTCLLFSSGRIVVTGSKNYYDSIFSSLYIARTLQSCIPGERFELIRCDVQNMVAHVELDVGQGILDIQAMYQRLCLNCSYCSRKFPGLIYRPKESPIVLLLFFSGIFLDLFARSNLPNARGRQGGDHGGQVNDRHLPGVEQAMACCQGVYREEMSLFITHELYSDEVFREEALLRRGL
jgi:transcription initiation factor TFIID TATA-box-binding protein